MRLLVCGGRSYGGNAQEVQALYNAIAALKPTVIIHGGATGADQLADKWAKRRGVPVEMYVAQWRLYGASAGPRRNLQMLEEGKPDLVLAAPGGAGTADMVRKALAAGLVVKYVREER